MKAVFWVVMSTRIPTAIIKVSPVITVISARIVVMWIIVLNVIIVVIVVMVIRAEQEKFYH